MVAGAVAAGIGFILASRADSFAPMFIAYMMVGVGIVASTIAPAAFVVANWFGARRGLAMGVTLGGTTTGGMLMTLAASYVIAHWGWRPAYLAFARVPDRDSVGSRGRAQSAAWRNANVGG